MIKKISAITSIVIGVGIAGIWVMLLAGGNVPELRTEPIRIAVHLFSEYLTAAFLLAGGIGTLLGRGWARRVFPVSMGMLIYSVLTGFGYFTQLGQYALTAMFALFFALAVLFVIVVREDRHAKLN